MCDCTPGPMPHNPPISPEALSALTLPQLYWLHQGLCDMFDHPGTAAAQEAAFTALTGAVDAEVLTRTCTSAADLAALALMSALPEGIWEDGLIALQIQARNILDKRSN